MYPIRMHMHINKYKVNAKLNTDLDFSQFLSNPTKSKRLLTFVSNVQEITEKLLNREADRVESFLRFFGNGKQIAGNALKLFLVEQRNRFQRRFRAGEPRCFKSASSPLSLNVYG